MNRYTFTLIISALLAGCTAEPPPDSLTGLMLLSQQVGTAGISVTPVSGHTHDYALLTGKAGLYISLRTQPAADVVIGPIGVSVASTVVTCTYCAGAASNYITITPANWTTAVFIGYTGVADQTVTGDQTYVMSFGTSASQDALYNGLSLASQTNVNEDRDRHIFFTSTVAAAMTGSGGIAGADAVCMSDAAKPQVPSGAVYKALLVDSNVSTVCAGGPCRRASLTPNTGDKQIDWVLHPQYLYLNPANSPMLYVDSTNIFPFGSSSAAAACNNNNNQTFAALSTTSIGATWSGLQCDWTSGAVGNTCSNWTSTVGTGIVGNPLSRGTNALATALQSCSLSLARLVCVQQ